MARRKNVTPWCNSAQLGHSLLPLTYPALTMRLGYQKEWTITLYQMAIPMFSCEMPDELQRQNVSFSFNTTMVATDYVNLCAQSKAICNILEYLSKILGRWRHHPKPRLNLQYILLLNEKELTRSGVKHEINTNPFT